MLSTKSILMLKKGLPTISLKIEEWYNLWQILSWPGLSPTFRGETKWLRGHVPQEWVYVHLSVCPQMVLSCHGSNCHRVSHPSWPSGPPRRIKIKQQSAQCSERLPHQVGKSEAALYWLFIMLHRNKCYAIILYIIYHIIYSKYTISGNQSNTSIHAQANALSYGL